MKTAQSEIIESEIIDSEINPTLPGIAKVVVSFYAATGLLCAALILSMTALHRGWVKVASYEVKSAQFHVSRVNLDVSRFR